MPDKFNVEKNCYLNKKFLPEWWWWWWRRRRKMTNFDSILIQLQHEEVQHTNPQPKSCYCWITNSYYVHINNTNNKDFKGYKSVQRDSRLYACELTPNSVPTDEYLPILTVTLPLTRKLHIRFPLIFNRTILWGKLPLQGLFFLDNFSMLYRFQPTPSYGAADGYIRWHAETALVTHLRHSQGRNWGKQQMISLDSRWVGQDSNRKVPTPQLCWAVVTVWAALFCTPFFRWIYYSSIANQI
jgi:hypothetical protein